MISSSLITHGTQLPFLCAYKTTLTEER